MRPSHIILSLCLALASNSNAGEVYKRVDAQGNVYYSDQASDGGEKFDVPPITTVPAIKVPPRSESEPRSDKGSPAVQVSITSPARDMAYHSPEGKVSIAVSVKPELSSDMQLVIKLDGKEISRGQAVTVQLSEIDRGTHQISASVLNNAGTTLASDNSTFTLHKPIIKKKAP